MQTYTKLTCEIKDCDGGIRQISIVESDWGVTMETLFDMMKSLALALDYHPDTVAEYFEPEEIEYETTKEIKDESY
jgi:hypothetical protein